MKQILTVSELTRNIQLLLESSFNRLWIEGEVSNLRRPGSGHVYFTLKDERSQIRAVVFRQALRSMKFALEDGLHIICRAAVTVYEPRGEYQLVIDTIEPKGIGALQIAFEQLKSRLQAEGLFDPARKRSIPFLPGRIGVITSPSGAVIRDILTITARRFPSIDILVAPVRVQGVEAAAEIVEALDQLNRFADVDVIILARGGGSLEDMAPFNDERLARAVGSSKIPVISAVGHEIDFTISDFVADLRAPTPSAAAELVVPLRKELAASIVDLHGRLQGQLNNILDDCRDNLYSLGERLQHPGRRLTDLRMNLDDIDVELKAAMLKRIEILRKGLSDKKTVLKYFSPAEKIGNRRLVLSNLKKSLIQTWLHRRDALKEKVRNEMALLDNLSPFAVLRRGYSIVRTLPEGRVVHEAGSLSVGSDIEVQLASGEVIAEVKDILRR